eukprot:TRINITY_DN27345_c0_g1_i1.p1 TRINITY_DN27345_c0_g1~~TRINITY_DN27345_c0_g1_i1.p1  ORF type:complete len:1450 (+),score=554.59 TRINITY_DN27345_c0_g1_i1:66-4415(+)
MAEPAAKRRAVDEEGAPAASPAKMVKSGDEASVRPPFKSRADQDEFFGVVQNVYGKISEGIDAWGELLAEGEERTNWFFETLLAVELHAMPDMVAETLLLVLIAAFQSLEKVAIREHLLKRVGVPLLLALSPKRREWEQEVFPKLKKKLAKMQKQVKADPTHLAAERQYFPTLLSSFLHTLAKVEALVTPGRVPGLPEAKRGPRLQKVLVLCCRYLELFIDLLSQLPSRRFLHCFLDDASLLVHCRHAKVKAGMDVAPKECALYTSLVAQFAEVLHFPVNNRTAEPLSTNDCETQNAARGTVFQRVCYKFFPEKLADGFMCSTAALADRPSLGKLLAKLDDSEVLELGERLGALDKAVAERADMPRDIALDILVEHHTRAHDFSNLVNVPLYPDEQTVYDESMVPGDVYTGETPLALPKLGLQFLTIQDYLLRNFKLMQLESTYEIREDIADCLRRLAPRVVYPQERHDDPDAELAPPSIEFRGRSRKGLPLISLQILKVAAPPIGFTRPAEVRGELHLSLAGMYQQHVRDEWDSVRQHDILILVGLTPNPNPKPGPTEKPYIVTRIRGCEVIDIHDDDGNAFTGRGEGVTLIGNARHIRVRFDPVQYQKDANSPEGAELYENSFNFVMRRNPEENNFKAVLDTIRELLYFPTVVPEWLQDVFLGYGEPDSAHYLKIESNDDSQEEDEEDEVVVRSQRAKVPEDARLYDKDVPKEHSIDFSPVQSRSIMTGIHPGLSLVVGPPGTGKTDVAVQIICNLYHKFPTQTTLVITHSNAALNDIFAKVVQKDVDERYFLRLGSGEKELGLAEDFSKWGRVNHMLERRIELLARVEKLCKALHLNEGFAHTCETSGQFFTHHVQPRWDRFMAEVKQIQGGAEALGENGDAPMGDNEKCTPAWVVDSFPFGAYFDDTRTPFWEKAESFESAVVIARNGWRHLAQLFADVQECRSFELLRNMGDRGNYLLIKQARVIAMTCTHAALKRKDFLRLNFKYDNLVMEESAQVLEIETFIPMTLQQPLENGQSRLKRVTLIGDHNQLPPVVKNETFKKYCHMEQSMFTRFVRLGVPTLQLNAQGRMRKELCDLFRWRYTDLKDLPHTQEGVYRTANAGLSHTYQMIHVDGNETCPQPHFYQNLQEAEYVVCLYKYMRLLGYPADKISVLTTYKGQLHLLKDVFNHRCKGDLYGEHPRISTVDRYQGQQNDFVLLSLVRTERAGHLCDVRRLVVALSRARLGLYIFGTLPLFSKIWELKPAFDMLARNPHQLCLNTTEVTNTTERAANDPGVQSVAPTCAALAQLVAKMEGVQDMLNARTRAMEAAAAAAAEQPSAEEEEMARMKAGSFVAAPKWRGAKGGYYFGSGAFGIGYYKDEWSTEYTQRLHDEVLAKEAKAAPAPPVASAVPRATAVKRPRAEAEAAAPAAPVKTGRAVEDRRRRALELVRQARMAAAEDDEDDE